MFLDVILTSLIVSSRIVLGTRKQLAAPYGLILILFYNDEVLTCLPNGLYFQLSIQMPLWFLVNNASDAFFCIFLC